MSRTSPPPVPGQTPPRNPFSPVSYERLPVQALRSLPIRENPRLLVCYWRTPSGQSEPARSHGHGFFRLGGELTAGFCLTKDGGQWFLETERRCYDAGAGRFTDAAFLAPLLADVYRAAQKQQIAAEGRAYVSNTYGSNASVSPAFGHGKGRN